MSVDDGVDDDDADGVDDDDADDAGLFVDGFFFKLTRCLSKYFSSFWNFETSWYNCL